MFNFTNYEKQLEKMVAPKDLIKSSILTEESTPLRCSMQSSENQVDTNELLYKNTKNTKKHSKNMWDVDIKSTGPGYFDELGNFVLSKPKKIIISWILDRNGSIEGPFSDREFRNMLGTIPRKNCLVKRDFDKGFVSLEKLLEEVPTLNFKEINKFFSKNQIIQENKKDDEFFEESVVTEKSTKLTNFLKNYEISVSISFVIKTIKNMRKVDAIEALKELTGLDKHVCTMLLDLIIEDANDQILCDVDKDGFYVGDQRKHNKRK